MSHNTVPLNYQLHSLRLIHHIITTSTYTIIASSRIPMLRLLFVLCYIYIFFHYTQTHMHKTQTHI